MTGQTTKRILGTVAIVLLGCGAVAWKVHDVLVNPDVALLLPEGGAQWIRNLPLHGLMLHGDEDCTAAYRTRFTVERSPKQAMLYVRPFRYAAVYLDGVLVFETNPDLGAWRQRYAFDLSQAPGFKPGAHELVISVRNRTGPPAVLAYSKALRIYTNPRWESKDILRPDWSPATSADAPVHNDIGESLERADKAFIDAWRVFVPIFLLVLLWTLAMERRQGAPLWLRRVTPSASGIRWALLIGWAILAANNITKLPYAFGFDVPNHMEYIEYVARKWRVPLATDGWQMFQSPLYYLLSAPLYVLFALFSETKAPEALRVVPLFCGALQVQFCYSAMRRVYPERNDLQALGTVLGGFLPINIYQSQYLGNEPLAAVFCSAVIVTALALLRDPIGRWSYKTFVFLGVFVGLGLLTKVTDLLVCGPLVLVILYAGYQRGKSHEKWIRGTIGFLFLTFGVAFLVCGWYYIRNWIELGSPFVGGWDKSRGYTWWQEPGYRTLSQFCRFGSALSYPIFSSVHGLWDGLYSTFWLDGYVGCADILEIPYWNLNFLFSAAWLSLIPTAALIIGSVATLLRPVKSARDGQFFALLCLTVYVLAIVMMMLRIASYSTLKGSYMLGIVCCFAILGARGFDTMTRSRVGRGVVYGAMACWVFAVYAGYFVLWTQPVH